MAITKILTINDCGRKFAGRHLQTAITYIIDPDKTQNMRYVTGINCQPEKAFDQMLATKPMCFAFHPNVKAWDWLQLRQWRAVCR